MRQYATLDGIFNETATRQYATPGGVVNETAGVAADPLVPGTASYSNLTKDSVDLDATDASDGTPPYVYQWERQTGEETWADIDGATTREYPWTGLTPSTEYTVRLKYTDDASEVEYSNTLTFTTLADGSIAVTAPVEDQFAAIGSSLAITFTVVNAGDVGTVDVMLTRGGGEPVPILTEQSISEGSNTKYWTVEGPEEASALITVGSTLGDAYDVSGTFIIHPAEAQVQARKRGRYNRMRL